MSRTFSNYFQLFYFFGLLPQAMARHGIRKETALVGGLLVNMDRGEMGQGSNGDDQKGYLVTPDYCMYAIRGTEH